MVYWLNKPGRTNSLYRDTESGSLPSPAGPFHQMLISADCIILIFLFLFFYILPYSLSFRLVIKKKLLSVWLPCLRRQKFFSSSDFFFNLLLIFDVLQAHSRVPVCGFPFVGLTWDSGASVGGSGAGYTLPLVWQTLSHSLSTHRFPHPSPSSPQPSVCLAFHLCSCPFQSLPPPFLAAYWVVTLFF